jgi:hypothetical protein
MAVPWWRRRWWWRRRRREGFVRAGCEGAPIAQTWLWADTKLAHGAFRRSVFIFLNFIYLYFLLILQN